MKHSAGDREQRSEYRLTGRAKVEIELEAADPELRLSAHTVTSYTRDVSAHGIRIETAESVRVGALLNAKVQLSPEERPFELVCEVVWCEATNAGEERWLIGLRMAESEDVRFLDWIEAVAEAMAGE
ncbi:PilZ domain-containing protein [Marinobacter zhejiangensis]|uniref:PilZ domain-containing protein n=1 Tax=Marinobacter zhejiangensis TaxID=488535 RepID=A0A1I4RUA2_9GAMM|nr:PilZ domain-containing protein [Marinobacter zhejiangensis]SFM55815.1 PilZ domain-containing protein [Marinobacter zhejiangensis]